MQFIFSIDTTNNKEVTAGLEIDGKVFVEKQPLDTRKAQIVLPLLETMLTKHKLTLRDLSGITVSPGPGSFTGIRVGITIANTLGFLLNIPVNRKEIGELVEANYF